MMRFMSRLHKNAVRDLISQTLERDKPLAHQAPSTDSRATTLSSINNKVLQSQSLIFLPSVKLPNYRS